jgi:surfeit locus 1 family protein
VWRVVFAGFIALLVAGLFALGVWQLERRVEKLSLIARVDARVHADPVPAPGPSDWPRINAANDEYLRVRVSGHYLSGKETLTKAVTEEGAGFWVMTPLVTDSGYTVLVNRGFVPDDRRDRATWTQSESASAVSVIGLLRLSEPRGGFLRTNDPAGDHWYSRDVGEIAAARGLSDVAPYFIDADATPNPGGLPIGGLTVIRFPNNHLVYAFTWFALGAGLAVGTVYAWRGR